MTKNETAFSYSDENTSQIYESIDEILCIMGGMQNFSMRPRVYDTIYAYDFHDNATALVYVASKAHHKPWDHWYQYPVTVHLLGFKQDTIYTKLYNALSELGKNKPSIWQESKQQP
jgi:hypothetical protein